MGNSDMRVSTLGRLSAFCALALLLCLALEMAIFRSGAYRFVMSPNSTTGEVSYMLRFEKSRPPSDKHYVLLTGDSSMENAFWVKLFDEENPKAPVKFVMAAIPGSILSWWYYALLQLDPHRDRYAAIVIPLHGYKVFPRTEDDENRYDTAQVLAPVLSIRDYGDLLTTFTDADVRRRATVLGIFLSHDFSSDFQDFIMHPFKRLQAIRRRYEIGLNPLYDFAGTPTTMDDLHLGANGHVDRYPGWFTNFKKLETDREFVRQTPDEARRLTANSEKFYKTWIGRIANAYRNSPTKLIFLSYPKGPVPLPAREPIAGASDLRDLTPHYDNIVWLDENEFADLERPKYFGDILHMNKSGRQIFTERFGKRVLAIVPH